MTAPVRIEKEAWTDLRFATLARLMGFVDLDHALIKVSKIWSWQTEHFTPDAPTYVVDTDIVESALGAGGAAALVRARLADETPDGLRIRGAHGRIEWLHRCRTNAPKGGEAKKRMARDKANPVGMPSGNPVDQPTPTPLTLSPSPEDLSPARARDADPERGREHRRRLRSELWRELGAARAAVAAELGIEARPLPAIGDPGEAALASRLATAGEQLDSVVADARHVIAVAVAEARAKRTVQWLTGALFEATSWRHALGMTLADASSAGARAGPRGSADRGAAPEPVRKIKTL